MKQTKKLPMHFWTTVMPTIWKFPTRTERVFAYRLRKILCKFTMAGKRNRFWGEECQFSFLSNLPFQAQKQRQRSGIHLENQAATDRLQFVFFCDFSDFSLHLLRYFFTFANWNDCVISASVILLVSFDFYSI